MIRRMTDREADQRSALDTLLDAHPRMLDSTKLSEREREAIRMLCQDGLATRLGDLVGATRAAVRSSTLRIGD